MISVIIPTYNRLSFLERCIESVIMQTFQDIEIILVDDGSTDGTKERYFLDPRIRYYYKENCGVSSARNFGIKISSGEFIAFLDSDDRWLPDKLEKQYAYLFKNDLDIVLTDVCCVDRDDRKIKEIRRREIIKKDGAVIKYILKEPYLMPPTVLCKKKVFEMAGYFDESLRTAEDVDLFLRLALHCRIGLVEEPLVIVCIQSHNSLSESLQSYEDHLYVMNRFFKDIEGDLNYDIDKKSVFAEIYFEYARELMVRGCYSEANRKFFKALAGDISLRCIYLLLKNNLWYIRTIIKNRFLYK